MNSKEGVQLKVFDLSIINYQIIDFTNKDKVRAVEKKTKKWKQKGEEKIIRNGIEVFILEYIYFSNKSINSNLYCDCVVNLLLNLSNLSN